jgi:hypothetical protein
MVRVALALVLTAAAGCASGSPEPSPSSETSVVAVPGSDCEGISLRDPAGTPVFLSGRWVGSGDPNALPAPSVYYIRQTNSCITWVGLSADDGEALGDSWVETFTGQLQADFTISGAWEEVPDGGFGDVTVGLEFEPSSSGYDVELVLLDSSGDSHLTKRWVRDEEDQ